MLEIGKPQEALDAFNRCTQITIKNATVWNYKGEALLQVGQYQDALDCFKTATSLDPNYTDAKKNIDLAINHGQVYLIGTPTPTLRPVSAITPPTLVPVTTETTITITTIQPAQTTEIVTIPIQTETSIPIKATYFSASGMDNDCVSVLCTLLLFFECGDNNLKFLITRINY